MKKLLLSLFMALLLTGCGNSTIIDTNYTYDKAIIKMPDGTVKEFRILRWADYEDGDQIQITDTDGNIYLVHSMNCVLINVGE